MEVAIHAVAKTFEYLKYPIFDWAWSPAVVFALAVIGSYALRLRVSGMVWRTLSVVLVGGLCLMACVYLVLPVLFEETEAAIAGISALVMRHGQAYPTPESASRYTLVYGPLTFLAHIPFYLVFGKSLFSFKLLGVVASFVSTLALYRICRHYAPAGFALVGLGAASVVLFRYLGVEFWGRIDPLILCMVALCLWAILDASTPTAIGVSALAMAVVPNLKLSGAAYLLPIAGFLLMRKGRRATLITLIAALVLVPLPFLLPEFSLSGYVFALKVAGGHGLDLSFLLRNLQYSLLLLAPVIAIIWSAGGRLSTDQKRYLALIGLGMILSSVAGSKNGAGSYHLIPYIVPIVHLYYWVRSNTPGFPAGEPFSRLAIPWVLAMLAFSVVHLRDVYGMIRDSRNGNAILSEIRRTEAAYEGTTLEIGFGGTFYDRRMEYVSVPVFDGQPYTLSASAVKDFQLSGVPMAPATLRYIQECGTKIWLIPRGDAPFTPTNNYYASEHPAFEEPFRRAFLSSYRKTATGDWFDVWSCSR